LQTFDLIAHTGTTKGRGKMKRAILGVLLIGVSSCADPKWMNSDEGWQFDGVPAHDRNEVRSQIKIDNTPRRTLGLQFNEPLWLQCVGDQEVRMQIGVGAYSGISENPIEMVLFSNHRLVATFTLTWEAVVERDRRYLDKWWRLRTNKFSLEELRDLGSTLVRDNGLFEIRYGLRNPRYRARGDDVFRAFVENCSSP
jgi:hypothetical protein